MKFHFLVIALVFAAAADAEIITFTDGGSSIEIEFVTVGNPGNAADEPDTNGHEWGSVDYVYKIAKFETDCNATDGIGPVSGTGWCGIGNGRRATALPLTTAAIFVNDLNEVSGFPPAYQFDELGFVLRPWEPSSPGYDIANPIRNSRARYVLPISDEWYKAAYYDPSTEQYFDYATGTNERIDVAKNTTAEFTFVWDFLAETRTAGGLSPYGTMGQTGNTGEWEEGGGWYRSGISDGYHNQTASRSRVRFSQVNGFRVVALTSGPPPGDLNGDGTVSFADFLILSDHFGNPGRLAQGDINGNGFVDFPDFLILANNFDSEPVMAPSVPEPSTLGLFLIGGLAALGRRRRRR